MKAKPTTIDFHCDGLFIRMNKAPYLIGKVVKIKDPEQAFDYFVKPATYNKAQVIGFNIFIVKSGFTFRPNKLVEESTINTLLEEMCDWYLQNHIWGKRKIIKDYKIVKSIDFNEQVDIVNIQKVGNKKIITTTGGYKFIQEGTRVSSYENDK